MPNDLRGIVLIYENDPATPSARDGRSLTHGFVMNRCVVIGAGIVGATTALALARRGFEVELVEAAAAPAQGASQANAGLLSPGHSFSWAEPGMIPTMLRSAVGLDGGVGVCQRFSPALWRWGLRFMRESTRARWETNSRAMVALAAYSRSVALAEPAIAGAAFGRRDEGILYLQPPGQSQHRGEARLLDEAGEPYQIWQRAKVLAEVPALAALDSGPGIFCPRDLTGNAARYAEEAVAAAAALGVRTAFEETVEGFEVHAGRIRAVNTSRRRLVADQVVVCAGLESASLLAPLGYRLPLYPLSGYSVTYEVAPGSGPRMGVVAVADKIAWAVYGDRTMRFTGFADVGIPGKRLAEQRFLALEAFARKVCPALAGGTPRRWIGQRPMTPDGVPIVGRSAHPNLWFNLGHGAMGWTMAHGSAELVADALVGIRTALDLRPYAWRR